ncbi:MAG: hypothetical protein Q4D62_05530 [Planctomycetia bacterium]|nr:hypothetical protein [Planctomycetia bacterium]
MKVFLMFCVWLGFGCFLLEGMEGRTEEYRPTSVWTSAETLENHPVEAMIDGDWATFGCLLDDSRTGNNAQTLPPNGSTPVTMTMVFDLGKIRKISGMRLVSHRFGSIRTPQSVRVFRCEDAQGKVNAELLTQNMNLPPVAFSNSLFATWEPISTRYVAVQVDDSWEKYHHAPLPTEPHVGFYIKGTQYKNEPYPNSGWWTYSWGHLLDQKGPEPIQEIPGLAEVDKPENHPWGKISGTPLSSRASGRGDKYLISLAEVTFFDREPGDITEPNPDNVAVHSGRLLRDWMLQDCGLDVSRCFCAKEGAGVEKAMLQRVFSELEQREMAPEVLENLKKRREMLADVPGCDPRWLRLYQDACELRRRLRLKEVAEKAQTIVYVKHHVLGGWTAYHWTEHLTDGLNDLRTLESRPGSQLCLLRIHPDGTTTHEVLIDKPHGIIRNPNFSVDGRWLVFSMRENLETDDFKLYVMDFETRKYRRITFNPVVNGQEQICADIEPTFTAEGKIVFNSTRCTQQDDCWVGACGNLFMCEADGSRIRRIGFDQVHTFYPQRLEDGRLIYTRWEYNDRTVFFIQSLFTMNSDGTAQTEFYGNQSWYPTSILHARGVPGTNKVIAILAGHHTQQRGQLVLIDRKKGTQGDAGIEFVAGARPDEGMRLKDGKSLESAQPGDFHVRYTLAGENISPTGRQPSNVMPGQVYQRNFYSCLDQWGQCGMQFQFPFALDEKHYLCSCLPEGSSLYKGPFHPGFGLYWITDRGERELLAFDWRISCTQSVVQPSPSEEVRPPKEENFSDSFGRYYVQNVYYGAGLKDVPPGTIRRLRVVGLEYRVFHVGSTRAQGISGDSPMHTVVANRGGTWDVKHVLGEVDVEADGSAYFEVPANTPVYFQMLDEKGRMVQTMRSWSTLRPGETFSCLGCHEDKNQIGWTVSNTATMAMRKPIQKLQPSAGIVHPLLERLEKQGLWGNIENYWTINQPREILAEGTVEGFSYRENIQPIWDRHCVSCHTGDTKNPEKEKASPLALTGEVVWVDNPQAHEYFQRKRAFSRSYLALTEESVKLSTLDEIQAFQARTGRLPWTSWPHALGPAGPVPPYSCGSTQSALMDYLEPEHYGVQLTENEKRRVACWMDLGIPFCGSYTEANLWTEEDKKRYQYEMDKRRGFLQSELEGLFPQK